MNLETRIRALETAAGNGWATPLFCDERPTPEQLVELSENARRGVRQLIFFARTDAAWLNLAGAPPWAA
jgi:hypothetical protein